MRSHRASLLSTIYLLVINEKGCEAKMAWF